MCCFMSSCRGTKTVVTLRGSPWSFVAVVQTGGKRENLFVLFVCFLKQKQYCDELCASKAGVSFELFCLQCASDEVIWLLIFLALCLLSLLYARPHSTPI